MWFSSGVGKHMFMLCQGTIAFTWIVHVGLFFFFLMSQWYKPNLLYKCNVNLDSFEGNSEYIGPAKDNGEKKIKPVLITKLDVSNGMFIRMH